VNHSNISLVPLQQANLCLDCEAITAAHTNCLCCGSQALLNIARILNHRTAHARVAKSPIPIRLASTRHREVSRIESTMQYLTGAQGKQSRFALPMSESRA